MSKHPDIGMPKVPISSIGLFNVKKSLSPGTFYMWTVKGLSQEEDETLESPGESRFEPSLDALSLRSDVISPIKILSERGGARAPRLRNR